MNLSSDQGSNGSEASGSESPSRKRPCTIALEDAASESTDSEPIAMGAEGIEAPDTLTNKKPRWLSLSMIYQSVVFTYRMLILRV